MKTTTLLLLAALTGILRAQGPLTPPGLPEPTMKTLDQIEPRTPIYSLPYTITQSGSYYFTGNLKFTATSGDAITIAASNVNLDLMGFTLSSSSGVTGEAISIAGTPTKGVVIRNGTIAGNTTVTASGAPLAWVTTPAGFSHGILDGSSRASFKDLSITGMRADGILSVSYATVENVRSEQNGGFGIIADFGSVSNSTASLNGSYGISVNSGRISNSNAVYNSSYGIFAPSGSVTNVVAKYNGSVGIYAPTGSVANCTSSNTSSSGILASTGSVTNSTASSNGGYGIVGISGSVTNSTAGSNTLVDINATNAAVAFCNFTTSNLTGSTRTGNYPAP